MSTRQIIMVFSVLFGCAIGLMSVHMMNAGLSLERDKILIFSFVTLSLGLIVGGVSIVNIRKDNERKQNP